MLIQGHLMFFIDIYYDNCVSLIHEQKCLCNCLHLLFYPLPISPYVSTSSDKKKNNVYCHVSQFLRILPYLAFIVMNYRDKYFGGQ